MEQWKERCTTKLILLQDCGWGNFRKHLRTLKLMSINDFRSDELNRYCCRFGIGVDDVLELVNEIIAHERHMEMLLRMHFGAMSQYMLTRTHSSSIANFHAWNLWKSNALDKLFPEGYQTIKNIQDRFVIKADILILLPAGHMMGALHLDNKWYFIDSNAEPPAAELVKVLGEVVRYPNHTVNRKIFDLGHCTAWTIFFIELLKTKGPIDYTKIPEYVLSTLFQNYCSSLFDRIG